MQALLCRALKAWSWQACKPRVQDSLGAASDAAPLTLRHDICKLGISGKRPHENFSLLMTTAEKMEKVLIDQLSVVMGAVPKRSLLNSESHQVSIFEIEEYCAGTILIEFH